MENSNKEMELKDRIIEESTKLFLQHGLKSIRMDDIASHMGISKRTLYELFRDRENLVLNCIGYFYDCQYAKHNEHIKHTRNIIEQFVMFLDNWEETVQMNINFMSDLKRFYPSVFEKVMSEKYETGVKRLKEQLAKGIEEGVFIPKLNIDFAAAMLTGAITNIFANPASYLSNNISESDAFKYIMMCFFRGIATSKGVRIIDRMMTEKFGTDKILNK